MSIQNICLFNAARSDSEYIGILNFVYEKNCGTYKDFGVISVFRLHLVTSGSGTIDTSYKREKLSMGDVFLTFPGTEYRINDEDNLQYIYISFVGIRAHKLLDRVGINKRDFVRTCRNLFKTCGNGKFRKHIIIISTSWLRGFCLPRWEIYATKATATN